jgi:cell division protein FtsZ
LQNEIEFDIQAPFLKTAEESVSPEPTVSHKEKEITFEIGDALNNARKEEVSPIVVAEQAPNDQFTIARERIAKLKALSMKIKSPNGLNDLEKVPAYVRKGYNLNNNIEEDATLSRYTLSEGENGKAEIKPNNTFLHDNVD